MKLATYDPLTKEFLFAQDLQARGMLITPDGSVIRPHPTLPGWRTKFIGLQVVEQYLPDPVDNHA